MIFMMTFELAAGASWRTTCTIPQRIIRIERRSICSKRVTSITEVVVVYKRRYWVFSNLIDITVKDFLKVIIIKIKRCSKGEPIINLLWSTVNWKRSASSIPLIYHRLWFVIWYTLQVSQLTQLGCYASLQKRFSQSHHHQNKDMQQRSICADVNQ